MRVALPLFLLTAIAVSADNTVDNDELIVLDDGDETVLVVRQRAATPLSPSSRTIQAEEFQGKFSDLPSVLETISGINIRTTGGHGQYAESAIRGAAAVGIRVYLDGVLLNSASGGAVDLSKIPLDRIREIRVTKSTSGLRQMGAGMGGIIELFTDVDRRMIGASIEAGNFGYVKGAMIFKSANDRTVRHQFNVDASSSDNNYPYMHDNHTTIPTLLNPDPTWDDTLMRKLNNYYKSANAAYSLSVDIGDNHKITQRLNAGMFDQGLFVYHYKNDQSGSTDGRSVIYNVDYQGIISNRLAIGGSASGVYRRSGISDPDGRFYLGGAKELVSSGGSADILVDARYSFTDNFYMSGLTGMRFEHHRQQNTALPGRPEMTRYEYRAGAEAGLETGAIAAALRAAYKYAIDTSAASLGLGNLLTDGKRYTLGYPLAEAVARVNLNPVSLQISAAASKRSPTFFERFGWSSGFVPNPDLREETRMEADIGASVDMGAYGVAASVFGGRVNDKIKSISSGPFVMVMNFAGTDFYGAELETVSKFARMLTVELSAAYLRSTVSSAASPNWIGKIEPYVPEWSGFLKTEADIRNFSIGHGVRYESECYLSVENIVKKDAQWELSAWAAYKPAGFLTLRYRVENYLNSANFDFLDNPVPRRTHVLSGTLIF